MGGSTDEDDHDSRIYSDEDVHTDVVSSSGHKRILKPRVLDNFLVSPKCHVLKPMDRRVLMFVRAWKDHSRHGRVVIACDGMDANKRNCHGVMGPKARVSDGCDRMASVMYTKSWAIDFAGKSKCIMLDPNYALSDARWELGKMSKWAKNTVEVLEPKD
ncbi:hypothetical protein SOVF_034730, partial [Spinacia oleracea]